MSKGRFCTSKTLSVRNDLLEKLARYAKENNKKQAHVLWEALDDWFNKNDKPVPKGRSILTAEELAELDSVE